LLNIPYNLETNDYTLALTARLPGPEIARAVIDHFDQLWAEGSTLGRSMAIGIHSFISGQALRAKYVREYLVHIQARGEAWLTTADAIHKLFTSPAGP
jgi:peptidoglycan/xylan/chitin deacetylase (PgdA/CDA1 family)